MALQKTRLADLDALSTVIGRPENLALGQQISDDALTLVRDNDKVLPLKKMGTIVGGLPYQRAEEVQNRVVVVVLSEDVRTEAGHTLLA